MVASMWRMNGLCRSMNGLLLICALLFNSQVMSQDDAMDEQPSTASNTATSGPPGDQLPALTSNTRPPQSDEHSGDFSADYTAVFTLSKIDDQAAGTVENLPDSSAYVTTNYVQPNVLQVECVGLGEISEQSAVKVEVTTTDCVTTKRILEGNPTQLCISEKCNLKIFQKDNNILMTSNDAKLGFLAEALQTETLKGELGLKKVDVPPASGSSVFVGILVTGLIAAVGIVVGYFLYQRRPETKGAKLAEEAYPVDQENQGNTLASEAPLNPPQETQDKPSVNGESLEAVKTETSPPTNGHSAAKTADTEL